MARSRTLESSAFVFLLGTLLAHRGGTEAATPFQYRHAPQSRPVLGWVHRRRGAGEDAGTTPEPVRCDGGLASTTATALSRSVSQQSLGVQIAAALRGGRSMRQMAEEEDSVDEEEDDLRGDGEQEEKEEEEGGKEGEEEVLYDDKAVEWMMQQLCMYQTRVALISNPLAAKVCAWFGLAFPFQIRLFMMKHAAGACGKFRAPPTEPAQIRIYCDVRTVAHVIAAAHVFVRFSHGPTGGRARRLRLQSIQTAEDSAVDSDVQVCSQPVN